MGLILYTGGCRSGKSTLALKKAQGLSKDVCFIATCVPQDEEMLARVKKHKRERPAHWRLIEEPVDLADSVSKVDPSLYPVILIDCLTLWVCNLMCRKNNPVNSEEQIGVETEKLLDAVKHYGDDVILVSNEVGMGIMPENAMARTYADLTGRCNQLIAQASDRTVFVSCGMELILKSRPEKQ